jgi:hypothetical protein
MFSTTLPGTADARPAGREAAMKEDKTLSRIPERFPTSIFVALVVGFISLGTGAAVVILLSQVQILGTHPAYSGTADATGSIFELCIMILFFLSAAFLAAYRSTKGRNAILVAGATVVSCAMLGGAIAMLFVAF